MYTNKRGKILSAIAGIWSGGYVTMYVKCNRLCDHAINLLFVWLFLRGWLGFCLSGGLRRVRTSFLSTTTSWQPEPKENKQLVIFS